MVTQIPRYQNTGLVLLFGNVLHYGVKNIPPATLGLIAGQTAIFLGAEFLPDLQNACISSYLILYAKDWLRMVLSPFYHGSDMHLYYNMLSLLYKGSWLEKKFGTPYYLYLIGVFTALINTMYVLLGFVLTKIFNDDGYLKACAVGFSGVLFGMKVLTTHYAPRGPQLLLGFIPMPYEYMYWAELVLISLLVPNASFVGHLAGILIGCAYTWGPLQYVMDIFMQPAGSSVDPPSGTTSPRQQSLENLPGQPQQGPANPPPAGARPREPSLDIIAHGSTQRGYLAGHLAGILIGCAHTWGPLQYATDEVMQTAGNSVDPPSGTTSPRQQSPENLPDQEQQGPASPREPSLDIIAHGSTQQGYPYLAGLSRTIHGMHSRD